MPGPVLRLKKLKSTIKKNFPSPPHPPPKLFFMTPPLAPKSLLTYGADCILHLDQIAFSFKL